MFLSGTLILKPVVGRGDARVWNNSDILGAKMQLLCFFVVRGFHFEASEIF